MEHCSRRSFLKTAGLGVLALAGPLQARAASRKPNVIIILTDDQGTLDVNCYGSGDLHTPNLDALALRGVRFSQFYVGASVCSPSRAALLTGRCPQRAEVPTNVGGENGLPPRQVTMAEMFRDAGYRTALFGKWHLGELPEMSPTAQGFDEFLGHKKGCIDNYSHFFYWSGPNRHDMWQGGTEHWEDGNFFPDMVVREAARYMEEHRDEPFFLYLPFNIPHYPLQGQAKYRAMYASLEEPRRSYAALVSTLDEKVGLVLGALDRHGLRDDTIVVFLSDHGHSVEERTNFGGGNAGPYRGHKFTFWEGGLRVPCMVSWPGHIPEGEVRGQMAISMDWLPTLAHYCGVEPPNHSLDGVNIAPLIASADAPSPHGALYWERDKQWAVREGDWKLVINGPASTHNGKDMAAEETFLSNLADDPGETNNLAAAHPDIVARLTELHEAWRIEVNNR